MWLLRLIRVGAILVPIVPRRVGYGICRLIGLFFYVGNVRARRQVRDNLRRVESDAPWLQREIDTARVFITVVTNYYDLVRLRTLDPERLAELVDIEGWEHFEAARARGRGVIILSAHVGNFSVVASYPAALGYHSAIIAERVEPPALFRYMTGLRSSLGIEVIPPGSEAIRPIVRLLRGNDVLLVAGDRDVVGHGVKLEIFGEPAPLPIGPVLLAMRTGATLLPAYTHRTSSGRSVVKVLPPLNLVDSGDWDADLQMNLCRMACALEEMIRPDPGQWAVLQRIWEPVSHYFADHGSGLGGIPIELRQTRQSTSRRVYRALHYVSRREAPLRRALDSDSPDRRETADVGPRTPPQA